MKSNQQEKRPLYQQKLYLLLIIQLHRPGAVSFHAMPGNIRSGFLTSALSSWATVPFFYIQMTPAGFEPATKSYEVAGSFNTSHRKIKQGNTWTRRVTFYRSSRETHHPLIRPAHGNWYLFLRSQSPGLSSSRKDYIYWIYDPSDSGTIGPNHAQGRLRKCRSIWFMTQHGINLPRSRSIFAGSVFTDHNPTFSFITRLIHLAW